MALSFIRRDVDRNKELINALESEKEKNLAMVAVDIIDEAISGFDYGYQLKRWALGSDSQAVELRNCISSLESGSKEARRLAKFYEWVVYMAPQFYTED